MFFKIGYLLLFMCVLRAKAQHCMEDDDCINTPEHWNHLAEMHLKERIEIALQKKLTAKNIIIFVGSGMSSSTITAARIIKGGENETFSFEKYPFSGHARTYCVDNQTPDSACAGTAFLTGVKTNIGVINVSPKVQRGECTLNEVEKLNSIAKWALKAGKVVGFATTSRITSGTVANLYASTTEKEWESSTLCLNKNISDIATQLIKGPVGKEFKVIFGGGKKHFLPSSYIDETGKPGVRTDNVNLIEEWKKSKDGNAVYISTDTELKNLDTSKIDYLLGLFESDRLLYDLEIKENNLKEEPPLVRLTHYSLEMLQKKEHKNGFLLLVENSLINEAHKENKPLTALNEVIEYDKALNMAKMMVKDTDTLVLSLSDVGSTMSIAGHAKPKTKPLDQAGMSDLDNKPYVSLSYATGPSHSLFYDDKGRKNPIEINENIKENSKKMCPSQIPLKEGVNGGEDVLVHASGPWSYLFSGSYEQNFIAYAIKYSACLDDACNSCGKMFLSIFTIIIAFMIKILI